MTRTAYGRKIYAIGGSYQAAYMSGINIKAIRTSTYVISAALSAVAGILMTSRVGAALMHLGSNWQMIVRGTLMIVAVFYSMWISDFVTRGKKHK